MLQSNRKQNKLSVSYADIGGRKFQAEGIDSTKALRQESNLTEVRMAAVQGNNCRRRDWMTWQSDMEALFFWCDRHFFKNTSLNNEKVFQRWILKLQSIKTTRTDMYSEKLNVPWTIDRVVKRYIFTTLKISCLFKY